LFEIQIFEVTSKEKKKIEHLVQEAISIVMIFNLDERSSFENLGNNITYLKNLFKNMEKDLYILGSSPNNDKSTYEEEVNCLVKTCDIKAQYNEIFIFDENSIKSYFNTLIQNSIDSLKTKKKGDKAGGAGESFKNCSIF
jgi:hypothetical protein